MTSWRPCRGEFKRQGGVCGGWVGLSLQNVATLTDATQVLAVTLFSRPWLVQSVALDLLLQTPSLHLHARTETPSCAKMPRWWACCNPSVEHEACLEMELSGCQTGRGVDRKLIQSGPPNPDKNHQKWWGASRPTIFD